MAKPKVKTKQETDVRRKAYSEQVEFINAKEMFCGFFGGRGSGKSEGGALKTLIYCAENPGAFIPVVAPTFDQLRDSTLKSIEKVFPRSLIIHKTERPLNLYLANGCQIWGRSADNPDSLRGPNVAAFWIDEGGTINKEAWLILVATLRQEGYPHQGWVTGTPRGYNWLWKEFVFEKRADYWFKVVSARSNPFLPPKYIESLEESYKNDPEFALQEIEGQFVIVGGKPFFSIETLKSMMSGIRPPVETREGCIEIWKKPVVAGKYVAGVDFSWGEKGSWSVGHISDFQTGEVVAKIRARLQPDEMALKMYNLCKEYNNAYLGAECNGEGRHGVNKLVELGYGNRMYHRSDKWYTDETKRGWLTSELTRPVMLSELEEAVRNRSVIINSENTLTEMMSFYRDEKGKPKHTEGTYDDEVMSLAIMWHMRTYATFNERTTLRVVEYGKNNHSKHALKVT